MRRSADLNRLLWLLRTYLAPYWGGMLVLLTTTALATALAALFPLLMAPILDLALGNPAIGSNAGTPIPTAQLSLKNLGAAVLHWMGVESVNDRFRAIVILCLAYVGVGVLKGAVDFGNYLLALWIRVQAAAAMQTDLFRHLLGLSMSFFTRHRTGDLISRFDRDTHAATAGLETFAGIFLTGPLLICVYGYLLMQTSPRLVVAAGVALVLHYGVTRALRAPVRRLVAGQLSAFGDLVAQIQESILSIRVVKSFSAESFEVMRLARALAKVVGVNLRFGIYKHVEEPARAAVNYVVEGGILVLAAWELLAGRLAAPTFFLFLYIGRAMMAQLGLLGSAYSQLQTALAAAGRVTELFDEMPTVKDGPEPIGEFRDRITLHDVTFDYGAERVVSRVNLEIRKGEVVALVGPSGAGKSTLADLILRLYDPVVGRITIDGRDLRAVRQRDYRRLFGVVSQEALLFNASIHDNITYGRDGLDEDAVVAAARAANAHDFIMQLPDGYATMVGDRGIRLSGGQRQRVAIARAIVGNPPILILDEATSSLDSESERLVQQAIERVIHGATSVVIAHRLSTVLHADKIVVVNGGGVEAVGRHAELLSVNETYSRLYRLQFAEEASVTT